MNSPSRSFFIVCLACILGVAAGAIYDKLIPDTRLLLVLAVLAAVAVLFRERTVRVALLALLAATAGLFSYNQTFFLPDVPTVADAIGHEIRLSGVVDEEVTRRSTSREAILDNVAIADSPVEGKLQVWLPQESEVSFGDTLVFRCKATAPEPIETFRYDKLLRSRGILAVCSYPNSLDVRNAPTIGFRERIFAFKRSAIDKLSLVLAQPHANFVAGLLFGGSSSLEKDIRDDFSRTGTSHIMAASGYNVAIFSSILLILLMRSALGKRRALIIVSVLVVLYVIIAGATPPVVRAGIMAAVALLGKWLGREQSMRNVLTFAAALMLLVSPRILFGDVGFQLSFLATAGLVVLSPKLEPYFEFIPNVIGFRESFVASISAILATTPILIWHFGSISVVAPLVNFLILPLIPYIMFFGALAIAAGFISAQLGILAALPAWGLSVIVLYIIGWFSSVSFASVNVKAVLPLTYSTALLCLFLIVWLHRKSFARELAEN